MRFIRTGRGKLRATMPKKPPRDKAGFRSSTPPRSAAHLLATLVQRGKLRDIDAQTTENTADLCTALRSLLPPELGPRLLGARIRDGELVLFTASAVWAGRLKLAANELIAAGRLPAGLPAGARVVTRLMPDAGFRR
ncbi:MAG: DciA family protein [Steroidobacteraceae bacterium]